MSIAENIAKIEERLLAVCGRTGRKRNEITLMGVSKFVPREMITDAFNSGIRYFGESRVKEAADKLNGFKEEYPQAQIHMIGSLQRNKAKQAVMFFDCIQSVDREELLFELIKHVSLRNMPLEVFLELHTGEQTKSGFNGLNALLKAAELVLSKPELKLSGLMTMAPFTDDADLIRSSFRQLTKARMELEKRFPELEKCLGLSMGMSNDFEIAIEEGSTLLRIGSAIFKE